MSSLVSVLPPLPLSHQLYFLLLIVFCFVGEVKDCLLILSPPLPFLSQLVLEIRWNKSSVCFVPCLLEMSFGVVERFQMKLPPY